MYSVDSFFQNKSPEIKRPEEIFTSGQISNYKNVFKTKCFVAAIYLTIIIRFVSLKLFPAVRL
jgi:hypothetical protein